MRHLRLTPTQVALVARWGEPDGFDAKGNPRRIGWAAEHRIRVVVALEDPHFVVTLFERRT
jgi:hypothetical protein